MNNHPRLRVVVLSLLVFLSTTWVYSVNGRNEFSRLDDYDYILRNDHIKEGLNFDSAKWALTEVGYAANWHPLTWMSHAADISLSTPENLCKFAHLENVVIHAINATLLFFLILLIFDDIAWALLAAAGALLWAIHPLRVEVVAWVAERKELLSTFFMLLTLISYRSKPVFGYFVSIFCFILALLAKPVAVSLPVLLFAYELVKRSKVWKVIPFMALSAGTCALTMGAQTAALQQGREFSLLTTVLCAVEAPIVYLRQTIWPFGLTVSYPMPTTILDMHFALGVVLLVAMIATGVWWFMRPNTINRIGVLMIAWLYCGLIPMLGIVKVGYQPHSDRYTYWIGAGAAVFLALGAKAALTRWQGWRRLEFNHLVCCPLVLLVLLTVLTRIQSSYWEKNLTVFTRAVKSAYLESDATVLVSLIFNAEKREGGPRAEAMAREVLARRKSSYARGLVALVKAVYDEPRTRRDPITGQEVSFEEARMLAGYALEESERSRHDLALAALGFIEYRSGNYQKAYDYMKEAFELGYKSDIIEVDLEEWKHKAEESHVQG